MPEFLRHQLNLFWLAVSFFSRLPTPATLAFSSDNMHRAGVYFSTVGWLLALIMMLVYYIMAPLIGIQPAVGLLIALNLLLTGAFHQDGLADMFDGFYGGFDQQQKLQIMKDSRIGTYGSCALVVSLLLQFVCLTTLAEQQHLYLALGIAYPLSRAMALSHVQSLPYVSAGERELSKSTALVNGYALPQLTILFVVASLALWWLSLIHIATLIAACLLLRALLNNRFKYHIQGITGDCLGAAQQCQELLIYMILIALMR